MPAIKITNLNAKLLQYTEKPWVKFLVNMNYTGGWFASLENKASNIFRADLGSAAIRLNEIFCNGMATDIEFMERTFLNKKGIARCSSRAKSAGGIFNKLEVGAKKGKVNDFESAKAYITDGKGLRVELKPLRRLSRFSINGMIKALRVEGRELTSQEKALLKKYIYSEYKMTPEEIERAFPIFEKFINPLIEKHSKPVYDEIMLSIIKNRMVKEGLTVSQVREEGLLSEELINTLMKKDIIPREYEILNNYRGEYGIPVFTNRQVQMMQKASGGKLIVHSRPDMLEYSRHPHAEVNKLDLGIKDSGYQGAQFKLANNAEEQYRGIFNSEYQEKEHDSYNAVRGKFLSGLGEKHANALKNLNDEEKILYNRYKANYSNAHARRDLGLPYKFPKLPNNFDESLSMRNINKIYKMNLKLEKANENFEPHYTNVA